MGLPDAVHEWRTRIRERGSPLRGAGWSGIGSLASGAATLAASATLVAASSVDVFADMAVLTVAVLLISTLLRFGADTVLLGEVHAAAESKGPTAGVTRATSLVEFAAGTGLVGGICASTGILSVPLDRALSSDLTQTECQILGLWLLAETLRFVLAEAFRWLGRFGWATFAGMGARMPVYFLLLVAIAWSGPVDRPRVMAAAAVASCGVCAVSLVPLAKELNWWQANPVSEFRRAWHGHSAMFITTVGATIIGGADVYIVARWLGAEMTAVYSFAVSLCGGITAIGTAVVFGVGPRLAHYLSTGETHAAQEFARRAAKSSGTAGGFVYLLLLVLGGPIGIRLGGDDYGDITMFIAVLGAGQVLALFAGLGGTSLILSRRYRVIALLTSLTALGFVVVASLIAVFQQNAISVALVSSLALVILKFGAAILAMKIIGIRTFGWRP